MNIIVAIDQNYGIGKNGLLPWHVSGDMKHFKTITTTVPTPLKQNAVIMGRKTWESLPPKSKPLTNRMNLVLTSKSTLNSTGIDIAKSLDQVLEMLSNLPLKEKVNQIFIIGGASLYELAIKHPKCHTIYLTRIHKIFDCDKFFPKFEDQFQLTESSEIYEENNIQYHFEKWTRKISVGG